MASAPLSAGLSVLMQPPSLAPAAVPEARENSGDRFGGSRGCYLCSRCGQPKKGHTCTGIVTAMARASQTDLAITGTPGRQDAARALAKALHAVAMASAVVEEDQMQTAPACIEEGQLGALILIANNANGGDGGGGGGGGGMGGGALVAASATSEVRMPTAAATQRPSICHGEVGVAAAACSTSTSCSSSIADGL